ncbi:MAG: cupin domain-containing protein [Methylocella sp.]
MGALDDFEGLDLRSDALKNQFDQEAFSFNHSIDKLDLFTIDNIHALARKYADCKHDYYIAHSATAPGAAFNSVPIASYRPDEALDQLESGSYRILLKRPENHDARFRDLLDALFGQVVDRLGGLGGERVVRLEAGLFISSGATTTPCHFDPEIAFFTQIEGQKTYHVYSPSVMREAELERFYRSGGVTIAEVDLATRDPSREQVFALEPGKGLHQPQNAPHWVETGKSRSISYSFVFETDASRARGRVRACNHYLRRLTLNPPLPGAYPRGDIVKSRAMGLALPIRRTLADIVHKMRA